MLWLVLLKIRLARIAFAKRRAYDLSRSSSVGGQGLGVTRAYLCRYFFLLLSGEIDEVVVLCAYEERNSRLVETSTLAIPLLDGIEGALSGQVEHEEYGNGVVAD